MTIEPILTEATSGISSRRRSVIRTADEWNVFWDELTQNRDPKPEAPALDFSRHMVIAAGMGGRPTGGYAITIEEVKRSGGRVLVVVRETSPGRRCLTTQAFTA
ncbi:MAG: protease complex subunit PrcB family protein, partial [Gemmatimonadales bacterium]